jgi:phosphate transport system protein
MARHAKHFEKEIEKLKKMVLTLGAEVEGSLQMSVKALTERNSALGLMVIDFDKKIDNMEVDVEEECLKILALYHPVANDLRLIVSILKINNDLERIGDLAVNIAERAVFLATQEKIEIPEDINEMARKTQWMLKSSLDGLVNSDPSLARQVCAADDEVDEINRSMFTHIGKKMQVHIERLDCYIQLLSASRYLERVADHTTNIAEDVIYLVEGEIVRHRRSDEGRGQTSPDSKLL